MLNVLAGATSMLAAVLVAVLIFNYSFPPSTCLESSSPSVTAFSLVVHGGIPG